MTRMLPPLAAVLLCLSHNLSAQVVLQPKYAEGTKSQVEITTKARQILTIAGTDTETESSTTTVNTVDVGKRKADGTLEITHKTSRLNVEATLPGIGKLTFDSADPGKAAPAPALEPLLDVFRVTLKNTTIKVLDKENKVQAVRVDDEAVGTLIPQLRSSFDPKNLKMQAIQEANQYPHEPVNAGDTWERTEVLSLDGGATLTLERSCEYTGPVEKDGRTLDRIAQTTKSAVLKQEGQGALKITKSDLKVESSESELLFDRQSGVTIFVSDNLRVSGTLTLQINGMELPGKLDLTIKSDTVTRSQGQPLVFRTWTAATGKSKVEAALVGVKDGKVQLKKKSNGAVISVRIDLLSEADRKFLDK